MQTRIHAPNIIPAVVVIICVDQAQRSFINVSIWSLKYTQTMIEMSINLIIETSSATKVRKGGVFMEVNAGEKEKLNVENEGARSSGSLPAQADETEALWRQDKSKEGLEGVLLVLATEPLSPQRA